MVFSNDYQTQAIIDVTMDLALRPQKNDRQKVIAAALRELVNQLRIEYEIEDYDEDNYDWGIYAKDILRICDELEEVQ